MTNFPAQIDNSISLPAAADNLTPVQASVVNNLRSAIIAIEASLGVNPGGSPGSVAAYLLYLDNLVNEKVVHGHFVELDGDLGPPMISGGVAEFPLVIGIQGRPVSDAQPNQNDVLTWSGIAWIPHPAQGGGGGGGITTLNGDVSAGPGAGIQTATVVGLQGRPVSSTAPSTNQVLTWDGAQWVPGAGGGGSPYTVSLTLTSPSSLQLVGATVTNPSFTATYSHTPQTAVLTDTDGHTDNVFGSPSSFNSPHTFSPASYHTTTFTLTSSDGAVTASDSRSITWTQKVYWGAGAAGGGNQAFILALTGGGNNLQGTQNGTFTVNASGQKVYYAYPTSYGTASFSVGGFSGGFGLDSTTVSFTNANGFTENYTLYESDNLLPGSVTFTVTHP